MSRLCPAGPEQAPRHPHWPAGLEVRCLLAGAHFGVEGTPDPTQALEDGQASIYLPPHPQRTYLPVSPNTRPHRGASVSPRPARVLKQLCLVHVIVSFSKAVLETSCCCERLTRVPRHSVLSVLPPGPAIAAGPSPCMPCGSAAQRCAEASCEHGRQPRASLAPRHVWWFVLSRGRKEGRTPVSIT